ncbi:50S ribosomal protein L10 [Isachenkonia alkalipeptolytica]|uniref:Large ribosomal subunit protein uL10 n=1 Tax=Isachenkonia alkalipeptolytica TaxID=2565777 RepID=A0AA44BFE1_9CLOT|nr:50S ribosomal protein L10 [Isachenkonia alkalipeptolytica]
MSKAIEKKKVIVEEIKDKFNRSTSMLVVDYRGLDVAEATELRKQFREAGVDYSVYRNTLIRRAAKETGNEALVEDLNGPNAIAFGYDDPIAPAKIAKNFAKDHEKLELKVGILEGEMYKGADLNKVASIPSREELIAKLLGSFKAPISNFAYMLKAVADKKQEEEA